MAEALKYTADNFLFSGLFDDVTTATRAGTFSPIEAYTWFQRERQNRRARPTADYCSTPITSGGHARRPDLDTLDVITRNTRLARLFAVDLVDSAVIHPSQAILPVDLGGIPHWGQSDYMTFWLSVISGINLGMAPTNRNATAFETSLSQMADRRNVNLTEMNSPLVSARNRAPHYFDFARAFAMTAHNLDEKSQPVHRVIGFPDSQFSLGCQTERLFAKLLGIPTYQVEVAGPGPTALSHAQPELRQDLEQIISYGAAEINLRQQNRFTLD